MSYRRTFISLIGCAVLAVTANSGLAGTIAEAKTHAANELVTIDNAVITSTTNLIATKNQSFTIQDATGGVTIFGAIADITPLLAIVGEGDAISITGKVSTYNGLFEVGMPFSNVVKLGHLGVPQPTPVTIADLQNSSTTGEGFESMLVKLSNVVFLSTGTFRSGTNYNVKDANNSGSTPFAVTRVSTSWLNLVGEPIPTVPVDLVGVFSQFSSAIPPVGGYQFLLRSKSDVVPVGGNYPPSVVTPAPLTLNKGAAAITLTIQATDSDGPFPLKYSIKSGAAGVGPSATLPFCGTLTDPASTPAGKDVTSGGPLTGNQVVFTPNADASGWFTFFLAADDGASVGDAKVTVYIQDSTRAVMTEIMYAPANRNVGEGQTTFDSDWEWVEVSNPTDSDIYLGSLLDGMLTTLDNLNYGVALPPHSTMVLMKPDRGVFSRSTLVTEWNPLADSSVIQMMGVGGEGEPRMNNDGDTLRLFDADGRLLDVVDYKINSGWPIPNYKSSIYLRRDMVDTVENDNGANWQLSVAGSCSAWGTPGGDVGSPGVIPTTFCSFPPNAENVEAFVTQDNAKGVLITLVGSDPDGSAVTFRILSDPASGILTDPASNPAGKVVTAGSVLTGATVTYTPAAGIGGNVTFTYRVNDGSYDSSPATVTVHIIPPVPDKVVITEIMYDPANAEPAWEWVEVHNLTDNPIDLKTLNDAKNENDGNLSGMTLLAHETKVIVKESITAAFLVEWSPLTADKVFSISGTNALPSLNNSGGDTLTLIGVDNAVLDTVVYEIGTNGWPKDADKRASIYLRAESLTTAGNDIGANWALSVDGVAGAFKSATSETDTTYDVGSPGTLSTPLPVIRGDFDRDGDVDMTDFATFKACVSGPAVPLAGDCAKADFDGDNDVDQVDFGIFQRCFSGSQAADPNCAS